jgi:SAM-dependent methyltransferase
MPESITPMYDVYQEYYARVSRSAAFSTYCRLVFGVDLSQDGFSDQKQLDFMIRELGLDETTHCLDVGCGNGRIAEYVARNTGASVDGLDYSERAIDFARAIAEPGGNLSFFQQDINELHLEPGKYAAIYLIDSIYFSAAYKTTLSTLYDALKPKGRLALFYSEFVFEKERQTRKVPGDETALYQAIRALGCACEIHDFTGDLFVLMKMKRQAGAALRDEFVGEKNEWLLDRINEQSIPEEMALSEFEKFTNRYLYWFRKES